LRRLSRRLKEEEEDVGSSRMIGFKLASGEEQAQTLEDPGGEEEYFGHTMHTAIEVAPLVVEYFQQGIRNMCLA